MPRGIPKKQESILQQEIDKQIFKELTGNATMSLKDYVFHLYKMIYLSKHYSLMNSVAWDSLMQQATDFANKGIEDDRRNSN